jgi:hypothetical protein
MNEKAQEKAQEKGVINVGSLSDILIFLSGMNIGKGDLLPLGTIVLKDLSDAISYLNGDMRFTTKHNAEKWITEEEGF